jgi:hypothetical protein
MIAGRREARSKMADAMHASRERNQSARRAPRPAAARHEALERRPGAAAPRNHAALLVRRTPAAGAIVQLAQTTNGAKISGSKKMVDAEVGKTIARNKPSEMLHDILLLKLSIAFRKTEQKRFKPGNKVYDTHAYRITVEQDARDALQEAYDKDKAERDKAKAAAAPPPAAAPPAAAANDGFVEVKRRK